MNRIEFMRIKAQTFSIPEVGRMLGVKKVESYWIVENRKLKTVMVRGHERVLKSAFWEWYDNQVRYQMVDGTPAGTKLRAMSYSITEAAEELGVSDCCIYELIKRGALKTFEVDTVMRIKKEDFSAWYATQNHYRNTADRKKDDELQAISYSLPDIRKMLGVHRNNVYSLLNSPKCRGQFEFLTVGDQKRVTKASFDAWLASHPSYLEKHKQYPQGTPKKQKPQAKKTVITVEEKPEKAPIPQKNAYTVEEAQQILNLSRKAIYNRIKRGTLLAVRIGNAYLISIK